MASSAISSSFNPQLEALIHAFEHAKADARQLLTGSDEGILSKRPSPDSWSALECIAHLYLGNTMMLSAIRQALAEAQPLPKRASEKYKMDLIGKLMAWCLEPGRLKIKAPSAIAKPVPHGSAQEDLREFEQHQDEAIDLIRSAAGRAIDACKMTSPFANIRYSTYSAFQIIAAHNRRHLWQAKNAVEKASK